MDINKNASLVGITGFGTFEYAEDFSFSDNPSVSSSRTSLGRFEFEEPSLRWWIVSGNSSLCQSLVDAEAAALEASGFTGAAVITDNLDGC